MGKLRALVAGATGVVGQELVAALASHPLFELAGLAVPARELGRSYRHALVAAGGAGWLVDGAPPAPALDMPVIDLAAIPAGEFDLAFSAVEEDLAGELEERLARELPVISTTAAYRDKEDVPVLLPPVNPHHAAMIPDQRKITGFRGFIVPLPAASVTGLVQTLAPLSERFGLRAAAVTSMQAASSAPRSAGFAAAEVIDNVLPFIHKEEPRMAFETRKVLGALRRDGTVGFVPHELKLSCTCVRVPVLQGNTTSVIASLGRPAAVDEVRQAFREWRGAEAARGLPSAPPQWIQLQEAPWRPQPRLDAGAGGGMVTTVGRIREDAVVENGIKYVLVSSDRKLGGARGAVLTAELLEAQGFLARPA